MPSSPRRSQARRRRPSRLGCRRAPPRRRRARDPQPGARVDAHRRGPARSSQIATPRAKRLLSVRIDGRPLADVARDCGVPLERRTLYLEEAEQERLTELLGAQRGRARRPDRPAMRAFCSCTSPSERVRARTIPRCGSRAADYLVRARDRARARDARALGMSTSELADAADLIAGLPAFALPAGRRARARRRELRAGRATRSAPSIVREGDEADAFYVLVSGTARVVKRAPHGEEVALNVLHRGDSFGEAGLLDETTRTATVRASSPVAGAAARSRASSRARPASHPEVRAGVRGARARPRRSGTSSALHSAFARAAGRGARAARRRARARSRSPAGELVVREGDPPGPMYVVEEGRLRAFRSSDGGAATTSTTCAAATSSASARCFRGEPRTASVEALDGLPAARACPPELFQRLLAEHPEFRGAARGAGRASTTTAALARVPLDFADEILPGRGRGAASRSAPDQVERAGRAQARGRVELEAERPRAGAAPRSPLPARLPARRDGLRRGVPRRWSAATSAGPSRISHIRELVHTSTDGTSLRGITRGAEELGLEARSVRASKSRLDRAAAAGDRALGGQPLGRPLRGRRATTSASPIPARGLRRLRARRVPREVDAATRRVLEHDAGASSSCRRRSRASAGSSRSSARTCGTLVDRGRCSRSSPPGSSSCSRSSRRSSSTTCCRTTTTSACSDVVIGGDRRACCSR